MRAVRIVALVAGLTLPLVAPISSSRPLSELPHYVVVDSAVREQLADAWDDVHADQHERAYCLGYVTARAWGATVYRVVAAVPAAVVESRPTGITARCPHDPFGGFGITMLHTHPPATCGPDETHCHLGGDNAYECFPSDLDERTLQATGAPFSLVQCDRRALVPYWPHPVS